MKKYSNSKAKRLANQGKTQEVDEETEIESLRNRRVQEAPESGSQLQSNGELKFDSLPISSKTLKGLTDANLTICTEIQAAALPHALSGRDILGAAKTGSGKTLSFVIPLIEKLYTERWSTDDGLAAIVITPTRELALQIFEVVRIVGKKHQFSAGLITGGKKEFEGEQERVIGMNILVSTPGRLLHHFEQTVGFDASQLMVLVLDEADRILDMGFKQQLDAIVEYLPTSRQTMLFSATQTKSVKDLARLSLKNAEYVAVRSEDNEVTPKQLIQNYIVCPLQDKLDVLFSFLKTHLKSKIIVFFSTCSQVRFVYECFRGMQPGIPLVALHGKIKQERRTMIYMDYIKKSAACLIATDIAARGLDFPNVDWVIQVDAPEDSAMYIHRVGRTARYNAGGRAMLMVIPQEEQQVSRQLSDAGVPIQKLTVNPKKTFSVAAKAAALLAAQPEYRLYAKKAFTGYLRSIQLLPSNSQLDVNKLPLDEFASSLGLGFTPPVPVVERGAAGREDVREKKNVNRSLDKLKKQIAEAKEAKKLAREQAKLEGTAASSSSKTSKKAAAVDSEDDSENEELLKNKKKKSKKDDKKKKVLAEEIEGEEDGEEFLTVKQTSTGNGNGSSKTEMEEEEVLLNKKPKKLKINMDGEQKGVKAAGAKKLAFDEEGNTVSAARITLESAAAASKGRTADEVAARIAQHASEVKARIDKGRREDAEREKQRIREKRLKAKRDNNEDSEGEEDDEGDGECRLANFEPEEESASESDGSDSESESEDDKKGKSRPSAAAKKRKDLTSSSESSSSSSDNSDSESEEESATNRKELQRPKWQQKQQAATKRKRGSDTSSDSGSDSDVDADAIKKQEELVMQMMKRKK